MSDINVQQQEIRTTREVVRELGSILTDIESGALSKVVIMSPLGKMRAVVISVDEYNKLKESS